MKKLFTSESVSEGHPDKICDQISDHILDEILKQDPKAKVACETFLMDNYLVIGGEISTAANYDAAKIARQVIKKIGYSSQSGLDPEKITIINRINKQSPDIAVGVELSNQELGAGDQGVMFGYATNESKTYLPLAISIANELVYLASKLRKDGKFKWARPDMKSQVTIEYDDHQSPKIDTILMSIQHDPDYHEKEFKTFIKKKIMDKVASDFNLNTNFKVLINPTGKFVLGGPKADTGLTGRKQIVDTYGGYARHGGGAFSGKDATKVDRTAAYMARYAAKNLVAAGLADRLEIQVSYAIGKPNPISINIEAFGTNHVPEEALYRALKDNFNFNVSNMIKTLSLTQPIFAKTATYGHFGKSDFQWEKLDKLNVLKKYKK